MSAKGRKRADGTEADVRADDFYATPAWVTARILKALDLPGGLWLEPSAGEGAIIAAVNARRPDVKWCAVEVDGSREAAIKSAGANWVLIGDFLAERPANVVRYPVCLGNPPFTLAARFVSQALEAADRVIFLLRLNFLESQERIPFFARVGCPDVYVLPDRPSFTGGGTDSTAYAWMEFRPGWAGRTSGRVGYLLPDDVAAQRGLFEATP